MAENLLLRIGSVMDGPDSRLTGARTSPQTEVRTNSSYLGIAGLACAAGLFFLRKRAAWQTSEATVFRLFVALTFLAHWLGLGVNTALSGQLAFLSHADSAWDPAIAISWGLLALQAVVIGIIVPGSLPARPWFASLAILVYFCVPGFRLIEGLPLYADIRAPHDFFEMGGVFCFSVAAGVAADLLIRQIPRRGARWATAAALLALASADSASVVPSFFKGPMNRQTFDDFLAAQKFLKTAHPGWSLPTRAAIFICSLPSFGTRAGDRSLRRPIHVARRSEIATGVSHRGRTSTTFLDIAGVSHLLIDKKDPDTPADLQDALRSLRAGL